MARFFVVALSVFVFACVGFVHADEEDYAGQEKILPETQRGTAPFSVSFTIPKDPAFTYRIKYGDGKDGLIKCSGSRTSCATVRLTHTFQEPGTYMVELFRLYEDEEGKISAKSLTGLAARGYVFVEEAKPVEAEPLCKQWFNGCVTCSREKQGGTFACPKKQCFGALQKKECKEFFRVNKVPKVRVTGPTSLAEGLQKTWTVSATDPDGERVGFAIQWGDEKNAPETPKKFYKSGVFSHTYNKPGTFTITAFSKDTSGGVGKKTMKVYIRDAYADTICSTEYTPVCGEFEGAYRTYSNECVMRKSRAKKKNDGPC